VIGLRHFLHWDITPFTAGQFQLFDGNMASHGRLLHVEQGWLAIQAAHAVPPCPVK
jgi:hypothetical protein